MTPIIYTMDDCPNCNVVKEEFHKKNISYCEKKLDTDVVCDLMINFNKVVTTAPVVLFKGSLYNHREILNYI